MFHPLWEDKVAIRVHKPQLETGEPKRVEPRSLCLPALRLTATPNWLKYYSLGLTSTAASSGSLGTGGSGEMGTGLGMGTYVLPPTRYIVSTRMTA